MAKGKKKKGSKKGKKRGGSQRTKFKKAAGVCRTEIGNSGLKPLSPSMWSAYGKCMKKEL